MYKKAKTGKFVPKNPGKVLEESCELVYKSSLERIIFLWCDNNANVVKWAYEPKTHKIPYKRLSEAGFYSGTGSTEMGVYHPDIYVHHMNKAGKIEKWLIEIKPYSQSIVPKMPKTFKSEKVKKTWMDKQYTFLKNKAKWETSERYCKSRNMKFMVMTEKTLKSNKKKEIPKKAKKKS